jgi:hypothetical protein
MTVACSFYVPTQWFYVVNFVRPPSDVHPNPDPAMVVHVVASTVEEAAREATAVVMEAWPEELPKLAIGAIVRVAPVHAVVPARVVS